MPISSLKDIWRETFKSPLKRRQIIIIVGTIIIFFAALPYFFNYIEKRNGIQLNDRLLAAIPAHNMSVAIFAIIWGMILLILVRALYNPTIFITYCLTLIFVTIARVTCIALVPLAPPAGLITLTDPLSGVFYGSANITKDLFFSGHTATLALIYFCLEGKKDKIVALIAVIAVACLLVVQHIHYTVDILTAPVVVYVFYTVTSRYLSKGHQKEKSKLKQEVLREAYSVVK